MEIDKKQIAEVIQDARRKAGLKQSELTEKIGISEKHLSKIETPHTYQIPISFNHFVRIFSFSPFL